ncbi:MAG: hypothetical protein ACQERX_06050 [Bacillota bacterium]
MPLLKTKGPKFGRCNICGEEHKLTTDHVPPKGTIKFPKMKLFNIIEALNAKPYQKNKGRDFQQGVKFRSLCKHCNGDLLGGYYDPELIKLANKISNYLSSFVTLPAKTTFSTSPGLIVRAVLGHILAIGVERFPRGEMGDAAAELVLDKDALLPEKLGVYYWIYPYWDQVSIRQFVFKVKLGTPSIVVSLIKFMPIAFMVTWNPDPNFNIPFYNLVDFAVGSGNNMAEIPVNFFNIPSQRYPEAPGDNGIALHGPESYYARRQ